jgi:hypothetical protein
MYCTEPGVNGYLVGWFRVKFCAKCLLPATHSFFPIIRAKYTFDSSYPFSKLVVSTNGGTQQQSHGHLKQNFCKKFIFLHGLL